MTESIKLMRLNLMMTKYYWKDILLAVIIFTIALLPNIPLVLNIVLFIAANTLLSYPFMIEEKDKMDKFYSIIAVTKKDIIKSKYLMAIFYMLMISVFLIPFNLMLYYVMKVKLSFLGVLLLISIGMFLYSVVSAIQLPCYFKWGYARTKIITIVLPFLIGLGVPIVVVTGRLLVGKEMMFHIGEIITGFLMNHYSLLIGSIGVGVILSFYLSYKISKKIYGNTK